MKFKNNILVFILLCSVALVAREPNIDTKSRKGAMKALMEGCAPATAQTNLNINNVRALILAGGDMWWDLDGNARYEVPKGGGRHSMFAGALWLGGIDEADQLKLAAMTYRQRGVDYWPGPLSDDNTASVTQATCREYDRQWLITREEVETHAAWIACKEDPNCDLDDRFAGYSIPNSIIRWPGNGIDGELANKLAPYIESASNGTPGFYDPEWDYPGYDLNREFDCRLKETDLLYGDQTIWWVYNDKGNVHTESQAGALGFEIRAQSFAFTSNDEINNMTFNNYRIINKSTFRLADTYFGTWFDPDLGNAVDDLIGCDITRGLGYCYNGDADDEGPRGYGLNPPAVGFDFFQGPFADYFDGLDNDRDGCVDGVRDSLGVNCISENIAAGVNERIIMSGFMYYVNGGSNPNISDPSTAEHFYNFLRSRWKNGNNLIITNPSGKGDNANGNGYTSDGSGEATVFAFPGESFDTTASGAGPIRNGGWWDSPGAAADKRGLHTAGPFSLSPGALNFITTGIVWSRNFASQDLFASVDQVIVASDKAQQLFDNCFQILDGPKTPEVEIVELDQEIVINLLNPFNDQTVFYSQRDPLIPVGKNPDGSDWTAAQILAARQNGYFDYRFEGFQIFQVSGPDVSVEDLYDPAQSRLVAQSDLENDVTQLVNYTTDPDLNDAPLVPEDKTIISNNEGIKLSYRFVEDQFATGDKRLINDREYYFYVVAYSQNNYIDFDPRSMGDDESAQKTPYLAGRDLGNGQKPRLAIPSKTQPRNNGTILNAEHGDAVRIKRLAGAGNGGQFLRISNDSRDQIVTSRNINEIDYQIGGGPFEITVANPFNVVAGNYTLTFTGDDANARWAVTDASGATIYESQNTISYKGEEILDDLGLSISFNNQLRPGDTAADNLGVIGGEITYEDPSLEWLSGVQDADTYDPTNWILAGTEGSSTGAAQFYTDFPGDAQGVFETILDGTWAPVYYGSNVKYETASGIQSPGYGVRADGMSSNIKDLANVDIVITSDPSKWTRVPVLEMSDLPENTVGNTEKFTLRKSPTLNKGANGELTSAGPVDPSDFTSFGWSYFPGYAINVETGRRLCMAFGENSFLRVGNGADLLWNPSPIQQTNFGLYVLGGMHTVYVFGDSVTLSGITYDLTYDSDVITDWPLYDIITRLEGSTFNKRNLFNGMHWMSLPLTNFGLSFQTYDEIPTTATVSLRVDKPYQQTKNNGFNQGFPQYVFSTEDKFSVKQDAATAEDALALVNIVPNPYYGGSLYEDSQLDNIVKITNLPPRCNVSIYMTNGTLIRTIDKDNSLTFVEWDMKNDYNVPISSGIYIIHVDAGETGEAVRKFMCTLRPVDLNAF